MYASVGVPLSNLFTFVSIGTDTRTKTHNNKNQWSNILYWHLHSVSRVLNGSKEFDTSTKTAIKSGQVRRDRKIHVPEKSPIPSTELYSSEKKKTKQQKKNNNKTTTSHSDVPPFHSQFSLHKMELKMKHHTRRRHRKSHRERATPQTHFSITDNEIR